MYKQITATELLELLKDGHVIEERHFVSRPLLPDPKHYDKEEVWYTIDGEEALDSGMDIEVAWKELVEAGTATSQIVFHTAQSHTIKLVMG